MQMNTKKITTKTYPKLTKKINCINNLLHTTFYQLFWGNETMKFPKLTLNLEGKIRTKIKKRSANNFKHEIVYDSYHEYDTINLNSTNYK